MTNSAQFPARLSQDLTAVIPASGTTSAAVDTHGTSIVGYILPATFTGTAITFEVSNDNSSFYSLYNTDGTEISHTVAQNTAVGISPLDFAGWRFIKFVSGSTEAAERTIAIQTRPL